jgi:acyl carrier protein
MMAVTAADIRELMRNVGIEKELIDELKPDVPLLQQGLDSIDLPVIAFATEKKYGVDIFNAEGLVLRTIDDLVAFLNENLQ